MRLFRQIAIFIVATGLFYVLFDNVAEFSIRQSIVLALVTAVLAFGIRYVAKRPLLTFNPYYVSVSPHWARILTDYKLLSSPEHWQTIEDSFDNLPSTEYNVLRQGIHFQVIQQSEDAEHTLLYSYYDRNFFSEVDFQRDLDPIKLRHPEHKFLDDYVVQFLMTWGINEGYNLGIIVPDWWWRENGSSCPAPIQVKNEYATGQVKLVLAVLPYSEFTLYWRPTKWDFNFNYKIVPKLTNRRNGLRKKFDWRTIEHEPIPELPIEYPESIEHKYFLVEHRKL